MSNIGTLLLDANADGMQELTTLSEKASTALQVFLLGFGTVFVVLIILFIVITLMGKIFYHGDKGKSTKESAAPAPAVPVVTEEVTAVPEEAEVTDDGELIAVITAAIAAFMAESGEGEGLSSGFRVVSFKRASTATPWNKNFR
ncbi:MAG: OadG family protein [Firmicutes bacterium]|nr:OadG family protein [Bacillota bacterium]